MNTRLPTREPGIDLEGIADADALRARLRAGRKTGCVAWIELHGLAVDNPNIHGALLHALTPFGLGGQRGGKPPTAAVLDWTRVEKVSAEGLALFAVLAGTLQSRGVDVIACAPGDGDVAALLETSDIRASCPDVRWIACASRYVNRARHCVESLAPAIPFGGALGRSPVRAFLASVGRVLGDLGIDGAETALATDAVAELLLNVLTHAGAEHASAAMLLHRRRRPRVVEIGVADGGTGIATNILAQPRHAWLAPLSDRAATAAVFEHALSGRDDADGGGGMTRIMRRLVDTCRATVTVRSGAAKIVLGHAGDGGLMAGRLRVAGHTFGWGTQTRIALTLDS
jgi:hypothetical protein